MRGRRTQALFLTSLGMVALGLGLLWIFREPLLVRVGEWLVVETPPREADLAVALGGDRMRQQAAVVLLSSGRAKKVLFVGSDVRPHDYRCLQVPLERTLPQPEAAHTTLEEALAVRRMVEEHGLHSVVVVTSPYHLRRARFTFQRVFGNTDVVLLMSAAPNTFFSSRDWWKTYIGRKSVTLEYIGLIYYWLTV